MWFPALHAGFLLAFVAATSSGQLSSSPSFSPGQPCQATGREGKCKEFQFCPAESRKFLALNCGFKGGKFFICCPDGETGSLTTSPIVSAPLVNFQCGQRGRIPISFGFGRRKRSSILPDLQIPNIPDIGVAIEGGIESVANSWPWMILLGRKQGPRAQYFCSAVLINNRYALTAAHCILDPAPFFARLGEHDHSREQLPFTVSGAEDVDVDGVIIHPKYEIGKGYNDLAILKLARAVNFRNEIRPVCLPWGSLANEPLVHKTVTVTGWGSERFGAAGSPVLREVDVKVFLPLFCHTSYSTLSEFEKAFPQGMNKDNIVCAGNILGGKDSCQGDSGGPIVHRGLGNSYYLAGIISKGYGCGRKDFPGIYAPIRNHDNLNWIKRVAF